MSEGQGCVVAYAPSPRRGGASRSLPGGERTPGESLQRPFGTRKGTGTMAEGSPGGEASPLLLSWLSSIPELNEFEEGVAEGERDESAPSPRTLTRFLPESCDWTSLST